MSLFNEKLRLKFLTCGIIFSLFVTGCVPVPYKVTPEIEIIENPILADDILLSVGPRQLLEKISNEITDHHEQIEIIDGNLFLDTAFPGGGWTLGELLEPSNCARVQRQLNIDYLLLVSREVYFEEGKAEGIFFPSPVTVLEINEESRISAVILDMKTAQIECQVTSEAHGTARINAVFFYGVITDPATDSSAIEGLAIGAGDKMNELSSSEDIRISVVAAESDL